MKSLIILLLSIFTTASLYADKADLYIREEMQKREIPGLAVAIIQNGKAIKTSTYGYANLEWQNKVTKDTVFEIGSVTKQFTAAGIMLLVQDGKLSLDDKINQHLKDTPPHWDNITVRQLLNHTSGIKSYTGINKGFELTARLNQEQFIQLIGTYPLEFQPGDNWKYCNSTYNLLGYIIENISGKTYFEFLGERIFAPLGMNATTNREPSIIIPRRASGYEKKRQSRERINRDYDLTDVWAAGAIVSTLGDMAKWDAALNTSNILSEASKAEMWKSTKLNNGTVKHYGLGWYVDPFEGHKNIGHSGSTSGFSASFQRFPDHKMTIILFCNSGESGVATALAKKIATFYLPETVVRN
ncbi:MAG: serine hydrolase domain-containing protein [Limisphaerales bacterium]